MDRLVMHDAHTSGQQLTNASATVLGQQTDCAVLSIDRGPYELAVSSALSVLNASENCWQSQCTWCSVRNTAFSA